jgi:phosphatidylinositol alpha-1,6-mannosyltransferase
LFLHGIEAWKAYGFLASTLLRRVDLFLSNSDYTWNRFIECNPSLAKGKHVTVPLGLGSPTGTQFQPVDNPPVALMISRVLRSEDYKGHREVIAAWPGVLRKLPGAELWVAGSGDLLEVLEQAVEARGLSPQIRFFGRISENKKQELITRCRCLVMPSLGEGFGLVYLEAMRTGRPCLVSTVDAGREVVNPPEAGLAVNPSDQQALIDAICRLLTPGREWEQWSTQARKRYEDYYTARHFQDRLLDALNPLIN